MPSKDLGEITFIPCGEWREDVTYQRLSIVSVEGSSYCAKRKNKGERPAAGSAYWQLIAARGAQGQQGPDLGLYLDDEGYICQIQEDNAT